MQETPEEHLRKIYPVFTMKGPFPRDFMEIGGNPGYSNINVSYES